ncbi:hypothetical protein CLHUN_02200 [Ruminiclostridium hungatei]|uniref:DUF2213 domain-containing protein n=1 Tax=Ruminiclostridium hungatei TaxID=48256 RepID=A0A1V4SRC5_RUMHU|nr:hypothetical protein [Ruminiclostridium hungatei]OPX46404.1 hypothetical protein CLHUN_02200 [Ruminiclostridium hungatei]
MSEILEITDQRLSRIQKFARRNLSKDEVFAFSNKSAGDMLIPGRSIRLSPEFLQQCVKDAQFGVSFMFNHSWSQFGSKGVPYGKVFDGRTQPDTENGETISMSLDKYIIRDDEAVDGVSANALIKRIETGVLSDTSIGWGTDTMVCSICGMNYYGGKCSHWKGATYEMADGTKKKCTVLAMPSSVILQNSNTNLYEESIVWDGAYPGASLSNDGDVIENPNGKFVVIDDYKSLNAGTVVLGQYYNGKLTTMVKKSDHKKVFALKGGENPMNEKLKNMLGTLGVAYEEGKTTFEELCNQLAEKWAAIPQVEAKEGEVDSYMTEEHAKEKLGKELSADEVLKLAKEGLDYHKQVVDEAIAMGVRAQGNGFPAETWKTTFSTMGTGAIKDIMKTFEAQAKAEIPAGRFTNPEAGQQKQAQSIPDEAFRV